MLSANVAEPQYSYSEQDPHSQVDTTIVPQQLNTLNEHICYLCNPKKSFNRRGELTRHLNEVHNPVAASKYLCPIGLCPRGIQGEGFGRMHHLVSHLKSKKHGMGGVEAAHLARMHNLPKSRGQVGQ